MIIFLFRLLTDPHTGLTDQQAELGIQRDGENKITTPLGELFLVTTTAIAHV